MDWAKWEKFQWDGWTESPTGVRRGGEKVETGNRDNFGGILQKKKSRVWKGLWALGSMFIRLCWILVAACKLLSCGMRTS